jgi:hypothetical protein
VNRFKALPSLLIVTPLSLATRATRLELGELGKGAGDSHLLGREVHEHGDIAFDSDYRAKAVAVMRDTVVKCENLDRFSHPVLEGAGGECPRLLHRFDCAPPHSLGQRWGHIHEVLVIRSDRQAGPQRRERALFGGLALPTALPLRQRLRRRSKGTGTPPGLQPHRGR